MQTTSRTHPGKQRWLCQGCFSFFRGFFCGKFEGPAKRFCYWRKFTVRPRRQFLASAIRAISISGAKDRNRISMEGWNRNPRATKNRSRSLRSAGHQKNMRTRSDSCGSVGLAPSECFEPFKGEYKIYFS